MQIELPEKGCDWESLKKEMSRRGYHDAKWREGKTAVYVFNAGEDVAQIQKDAYTMYMSENGLGPLAFPSLKQMEEEVVGMGLNLLHGPNNSAGTITSGGTDSITMAIKAARDFAQNELGIRDTLNAVMPFSAHPAFDKACHLMAIETRRVAVGTDLLADADAMGKACDEKTILLVGSAPSFPYGLSDNIVALGEIASKKKIWLHVDACVGGYIAPFVRMNGTNIQPFDFEVPSVSSISADLHKYGYCAKGASTVFFRSESLKQHMIFDCADWPGGRMVTPTLAGTRPGGAISAAWAVMNYLGVEGYRKKQKLVTDARYLIEKGIKALGFNLLGKPQLGIMAFTHPSLDVFAIYKQMYERGWFTSLTTTPKALHLMLSPFHAQVTDTYLADLKSSTETVATGKSESITEARYS